MNQRHWKSSFMSPSRVDNYVYHMNEEHYYQVEIWDKPPQKIPQWLDAVYCNGFLYFQKDKELKHYNYTTLSHKCNTITQLRDHITLDYNYLICKGFRTYDESHLNKFLCDLLKLSPTTAKMEAGTAVHEYLEKLLIGEVPSEFTNNGWSISVNPKLNCELYLPLQREQWIRKYFNDILIIGKADCLGCDIIHDLKTTKAIDIEKYIDSWQWKIYLWMTGLSKFQYNIFETKTNEKDKTIIINDYQELNLYRYKNLDDDVLQIYQKYSDYLDLLKPHIDKYKLLKEVTK